jgi:hypothetical protein
LKDVAAVAGNLLKVGQGFDGLLRMSLKKVP